MYELQQTPKISVKLKVGFHWLVPKDKASTRSQETKHLVYACPSSGRSGKSTKSMLTHRQMSIDAGRTIHISTANLKSGARKLALKQNQCKRVVYHKKNIKYYMQTNRTNWSKFDMIGMSVRVSACAKNLYLKPNNYFLYVKLIRIDLCID